MLKPLLKNLFAGLGYELRRKTGPARRGYELETEAETAIAKIRPFTMLPPERLITLYQQAAHCEEVRLPGAFVECGVWKGGSVALMALANLERGAARRDLHLFDSFTDICEPDQAVDGERAVREVKAWSKDGGTAGKLAPVAGFYDSMGGAGTLAGNKDLLEKTVGYPAERIHYHVGWFQDTLPKAGIPEIAILRLDGDWYASTKVCLEHLYDKVVPGGFVIIDDYGAYEGCRKAVDEFRKNKGITAYLHHIDGESRYWIK
ncbi:MAG: class I SAM-dependent methyltransferase [Elusimicrobia bacterium]|nr:class I SAM-dependent methyltransferase [Elusimicrobiota bacterium]